ncbi:uncharacterized protein C8Q71DRAFT_223569 [Rhodofomes roseus]|uniref:Uncharacterized protein n=1 Tax=Rhodofomes roseus TaxID=34475 RepID=A0ABQ8KUT4_9APHY|nr:uncharacterized protein C8Q71DRAFT_223569 [Rhodofomes roseus]KAH9842840.1 hypothetical protein C8Q71DRAFT_223569 [Rhodofomes roseus]
MSLSHPEHLRPPSILILIPSAPAARPARSEPKPNAKQPRPHNNHCQLAKKDARLRPLNHSRQCHRARSHGVACGALVCRHRRLSQTRVLATVALPLARTIALLYIRRSPRLRALASSDPRRHSSVQHRASPVPGCSIPLSILSSSAARGRRPIPVISFVCVAFRGAVGTGPAQMKSSLIRALSRAHGSPAMSALATGCSPEPSWLKTDGRTSVAAAAHAGSEFS